MTPQKEISPCFFTAVFLVNLSVLGYGYYFSTTIDIELSYS